MIYRMKTGGYIDLSKVVFIGGLDVDSDWRSADGTNFSIQIQLLPKPLYVTSYLREESLVVDCYHDLVAAWLEFRNGNPQDKPEKMFVRNKE